MARLNDVEATNVVARANLRIATSLVEPLHNARENDVPVSKLLKRSYSQEFKSVAGEVCYQLGLVHERRAEAAALRALEGDILGLIALPELYWTDVMRCADLCFRATLRQRVIGAAARICKCHQIEHGINTCLGFKPMQQYSAYPFNINSLRTRRGLTRPHQKLSYVRVQIGNATLRVKLTSHQARSYQALQRVEFCQSSSRKYQHQSQTHFRPG